MKGKPLGIGGVISESEEDIRNEMLAAFKRMKDDEEYETLRDNTAKVHQIVKDSIERGKAHENMDALVKKLLRGQM